MRVYAVSGSGSVLPTSPHPPPISGHVKLWDIFSGERSRQTVESAVGRTLLRRESRAILVDSTLLHLVPCRLVAWSKVAPPQVTHNLTERELEVMRLYAEDLGPKQIALKLNITESTVHKHRKAAVRKLGFRGAIKAALWLREHGLI